MPPFFQHDRGIVFEVSPESQAPLCAALVKQLEPLKAWHRRRLFKIRLIIIAGITLLFAITLVALGMRSLPRLDGTWGAIFALWLFCQLFMLGFRLERDARIIAFFRIGERRARAKVRFRPYTLSVLATRRGLFLSRNQIPMLIRWHLVDEIIQGPGFIAIMCSAARPSPMLCIPLEKSNPEYQRFFNLAMAAISAHDQATGEHGTALARYLKRHPCSCPRCEYNLTNLTTDTCPGCGLELGIIMLAAWSLIRPPSADFPTS